MSTLDSLIRFCEAPQKEKMILGCNNKAKIRTKMQSIQAEVSYWIFPPYHEKIDEVIRHLVLWNWPHLQNNLNGENINLYNFSSEENATFWSVAFLQHLSRCELGSISPTLYAQLKVTFASVELYCFYGTLNKI